MALVVITALNDHYIVVPDVIHKSVFTVNSARPHARKFVLQRFGISDALVGASECGFDQ
jgi:hypothetical protein